MNIKITPRKLKGTVKAPSSEEYAHMIITAAALADKIADIEINTVSDAILKTMNAARSLGAKIWDNGDGSFTFYCSGRGMKSCFADACGSPLTLALMLPVIAAVYGYGEFTGGGTADKENLLPLINFMRERGCRIASDTLPFIVRGFLKAGQYVLPDDMNPKYVSGILLALALASGESEVFYAGAGRNEKHINTVIDVLSVFGIHISEREGRYSVPQENILHSPSRIKVPCDIFRAEAWLAADFMGCDIEITGCKTDWGSAFWRLLKKDGDIIINASKTPLSLYMLSVICAARKGRCRVTGLTGNCEKTGVCVFLSSLGGKIVPAEDGFTVWGEGNLRGGVCDAGKTPDIAIAAGAASVICTGDVTVLNAETANKKYSSFWNVFRSLGGFFCDFT